MRQDGSGETGRSEMRQTGGERREVAKRRKAMRQAGVGGARREITRDNDDTKKIPDNYFNQRHFSA